MTSGYARASFFDASALVRVYVDEPGSELVRDYFNSEPTKFTTQFCFYETLNVLKSKWIHRQLITRDQYLEASFRFVAWYGMMRRTTSDLDFTDPTVFFKARELAERTGLDLSDTMQMLSVSLGDYSSFCDGSKTVFVTADKTLARVARLEGLRVWSVHEETAPQ
jgi:predicted nucleic acid-binding protein